MMEDFQCECGWRFILTRKWMFGPILPENMTGPKVGTDAHLARVLPIDQFAEQWGHCARYREIQTERANLRFPELKDTCRRCQSRNIAPNPDGEYCTDCGYGLPGDRASVSVRHDGQSPSM